MDHGLPHLRAVTPYAPGKPLQVLERELGIVNAIKLASNESPMGPSERVLEAMAGVAPTLARYPENESPELRQRLAALHGVSPQELCFGHGSSELIDLLCRCFAGPGHHAVIGAPSFVCYGLCLKIANVPTTEVPLREGVHWDLPAMLEAVRPETRLLFIDNPNNPTSTHVGRHALEGFLRVLPEHVLPVIDEAYAHFADAPDYQSALALREVCPRLVVLRTFSKAYGLAALRVGYAVAPAVVTDYLERVRLPFNVGTLSQTAAVAALSDQAHVDAYVQLNRSERNRLSAELAGLGLRVANSQANFLFVDVDRPAQPLYEALLRAGVIVRQLPGVPRALRISIGLPPENDRLLGQLQALL